MLNKIKTAIDDRTWFQIEVSQRRTFDEMMEEYFSLIDDKPSTLSCKEDAFAHLEDFFGGLALNRITSHLVDKYKKKRRHDGAADSTTLSEVRLLSHAYNTVGWTRENPVRGAKLIELKAGEINRWLIDDEERALLAKTEGKLDGHLTDIIILDLNVGMSQEGILKLDWRQVGLFKKTLTTGRKKTEKRGLNMRTIPLNETAYAFLKMRASTGMSGYVFHDGAGNMIKLIDLKRRSVRPYNRRALHIFAFMIVATPSQRSLPREEWTFTP